MTETATDLLIPAFARALLKVENVRKTKEADAEKYKYRYATLEDVLAEVNKALHSEGLVLSLLPGATPDGANWTLTPWLIHVESGQNMRLDAYTRPKVGAEQGFGSALSYGRRYLLMTVFGIAPEDDDGAEATRAQREIEKWDGARTAAESAIRTILGAQSEGVKVAFGQAFQQRFGVKLAGLDERRHQEALDWTVGNLDFIVGEYEQAQLEAAADDGIEAGVTT